MVIVLFAKTPFEIDMQSSLQTGKLYINGGGSIYDSTTNTTFIVHEKARLDLPYNINYIYFDIWEKVYRVFESQNLENFRLKLIYSIGLISGPGSSINSVTDITKGDTYANLGAELSKAIIRDGVELYDEQNLIMLESSGNYLDVKYPVREVQKIYLRFTDTNNQIKGFGVLDLQSISSLSGNRINFKYSIFRGVMKTAKIPIKNVIFDITYSH